MLTPGSTSYNLLLVLMKHPFLCLTLLIMPFSSAPLLTDNIAGISGMKPFNLLALGMMISWLWKGGGRCKDRQESQAVLIYIIFFILFTLAFCRSLLEFDVLFIRYNTVFPSSPAGFILSYWVVGLLYSFSFLYIIQLIRSPRQILGLVSLLLCSFICFNLFSFFITYSVNAHDYYRKDLVSAFSNSLGLHYNTAATIIMIGIPITIGFSLQYGKKYFLIVLFMLLTLILAGSRGAILGALIGSVFVIYMNLDGKFSAVLKLLSIVIFTWIVSNFLLTFLSQGQTGLTLNELSSGRLESMWQPLLIELNNSIIKLIFGMGMFGMILSDSYVFVHGFFTATHAHNAYLNLLMDGGIIFLSLLLWLIFTSLKKAVNVSRVKSNALYFGLVGSIIAYLIAGLFGRQFFPTSDNMMLFPVIALTLIYYRLSKQERLVK
jgi:hypothetical protein